MTKNISLEKSLDELENLVNQLEKGDISLETALKHYEKGIQLARKCQTALQQAEQKIQHLSLTPTEDTIPNDTNVR